MFEFGGGVPRGGPQNPKVHPKLKICPFFIVNNQLNINTENSALEIFTVDECSFDFLLCSFDEPFLPLSLTVFRMEIVERVEWVLPLLHSK